MAVEKLVETVMSELRQMANSRTVVSEPISAGENTVIVPVSKVTLGFGAGGGGFHRDNGDDTETGNMGQGTGGGLSIEPVAFIVVSNGKPTLLPLAHTEATLSKVIDLVPEVLGKLRGLGGKKNDDNGNVEDESEDNEE